MPDQRSTAKPRVKNQTGFDLVPGINCPSVPHKSGLSCREQRKRAIAGSESRTTLNVGEKLGFTAQRQFKTGRRGCQGDAVVLNPKTWTRSLSLHFHMSPVFYRTHSTCFQTNTFIVIIINIINNITSE